MALSCFHPSCEQRECPRVPALPGIENHNLSHPNSQNQPQKSGKKAQSFLLEESPHLPAMDENKEQSLSASFYRKPLLICPWDQRTQQQGEIAPPWPLLLRFGVSSSRWGRGAAWTAAPTSTTCPVWGDRALLPHLTVLVLTPVLSKHFTANRSPALFASVIHPKPYTHTPDLPPPHACLILGWGRDCRVAPQWGADKSLLPSSLHWVLALAGWGGLRVGDQLATQGKSNDPGCCFQVLGINISGAAL